jgi:hypothetical protein
LIVVAVAGCGGGPKSDFGNHGTATPPSGLARHLNEWSTAAVGYATTIANCANSPNPGRGYWHGCTSRYAAIYGRATQRLGTDSPPPSGCAADIANVVNAVRRLTPELGRASRLNARFLAAVDKFRRYHGPSPLLAADGAETDAKRAAYAADRAAARLKAGC